MRQTLIALTLASVAALVAVSVWAYFRRESPPVFQNVHYSTPDNWQTFYGSVRRRETGWIHIPTPPSDPPFRSQDDPFAKGWVKPEVCGECHSDIWKQFQTTAHFRTSSEPNSKTVLAPYSDSPRPFTTRDPRLSFELVHRDGQFLQTVHYREGETDFSHSEPIGLVTGSGNHGQSYLFWKGDALYQLPLSYFTETKSWVNSPGIYTDGTADFGRPIGDRCLDCHLTYAASKPNSFHRYDRSNFILGVTCVRCHGSGWAHVQFQRTHPDSEAKYITNPSRLSRDRTNEVCAQCHSGIGTLRRDAFTYQPGEPLDEYLHFEETVHDPRNDDPHAANQLARLRRSRCYEQSESMTCITCHDPHQVETGQTAVFSRRCQTCHQPPDCGMHKELGAVIETACIRCHMAAKRDEDGKMQTADGELLPKLRDHYIRIWPDLSKTIADALKTEGAGKSPVSGP